MKKLSDEELAALKLQHAGSELTAYDNDELELHVVHKTPNWQNWSAFRRDVQDPDEAQKIIKLMVATHLVYPTPAEFEKYLDTRPAVCSAVMTSISTAAGVSAGGVRKKL